MTNWQFSLHLFSMAQMGVSWNGATPKSSNLTGSIINHPVIKGYPIPQEISVNHRPTAVPGARPDLMLPQVRKHLMDGGERRPGKPRPKYVSHLSSSKTGVTLKFACLIEFNNNEYDWNMICTGVNQYLPPSWTMFFLDVLEGSRLQ